MIIPFCTQVMARLFSPLVQEEGVALQFWTCDWAMAKWYCARSMWQGNLKIPLICAMLGRQRPWIYRAPALTSSYLNSDSGFLHPHGMLEPLGLCLCLPSAICNKGFGGTDQEWQAEFEILKKECAQAALGSGADAWYVYIYIYYT